MHSTRTNIRITEFVGLPWFRNRKIAGMEIESASICHEDQVSSFDKMDFNAFVPVGVEPPILWTGTIPKTNAFQARQRIVWNGYSRIMALAKSSRPEFASSDRQKLSLTTINAGSG